MVWQSTDAVRAGSELRNLAFFWLSAVSAGWLQMILIARGVRISFGPARYPGWALLGASALIGALPLTFQVRWLMETIVVPAAGLPPPWITYLNVCVINAVFSVIQYALIERWPILGTVAEVTSDQVDNGSGLSNPDNSNSTHASSPNITMLRRKPERLRGEIRYMQMEDHYLRIFTDHGNELVLHRMSDAVEDLEQSDGLQVHKSWWVSRSAVGEIRNENRKRSIVTSDGKVIPIGRSYEKSLKINGWL